jgi:hypothetical protein
MWHMARVKKANASVRHVGPGQVIYMACARAVWPRGMGPHVGQDQESRRPTHLYALGRAMMIQALVAPPHW